jgi:phosphoglycerol transferase
LLRASESEHQAARRRAVLGALLAVGLTLAALALLVPAVFLRDVPLLYRGDGLSHALVVKTVLDVGWYPAHNPRLGAPFGATWFDYPNGDAANLFLIKLLGAFSGDWIVVANSFFVATFVLCALSAYLVMQRLGLRWDFAAVGAMLFALLPYHFLRLQHVLLAAYWSVPLGVYLAVACGPDATAPKSPSVSRHLTILALLALAAGCGGIYYAFFAAVLVAASGAANVVVQRRWRASGRAMTVIAVIALATAVQLVPSLWYWHENGHNAQAVSRSPEEAERYAFKPIQLFLPQSRHRIETARKLASDYAASSPSVNENATSALGIVGAVGLVLILAHGLRRMLVQRPRDPPLDSLAWQALVALALGTTGGIGSMLAYAGFSGLRGYNRISVFLGFIAISALLLLLQRRLLKARDARRAASIGGAVVATIAVIGALDQTPMRPLRIESASFASDREFFATLERQIPGAAAVYQLPYHPFPEAGAENDLEDYGLVRGYLNTKALSWSYGAMKGRAGDEWLRLLSKRDIDDQLDLAAKSGFGAVYIDRRGYGDRGAAIEADIRRRLGTPIAQSADGMLAAYRVQPTGTTPVAREALLPAIDTVIRLDRPVLSPLVSKFSGFAGFESAGRWTEGSVARIELARPLPRRFILRLETAMAMGPSADVDLPIRIGGVGHSIRVGRERTVTETPFDVDDPGRAIEIVIANPASPRELGINADTRRLGILVTSIAILPGAGN